MEDKIYNQGKFLNKFHFSCIEKGIFHSKLTHLICGLWHGSLGKEKNNAPNFYLLKYIYTIV